MKSCAFCDLPEIKGREIATNNLAMAFREYQVNPSLKLHKVIHPLTQFLAGSKMKVRIVNKFLNY